MSDNELIAEFMGYDVYERELFGNTVRVFAIKTEDSVDRALSERHVNLLKYDTSWDWLMPVVEKIEGLGYPTYAGKSEFNGKQYINIITNVGILNQTVNNPSKLMAQDEVKINAYYKTVVEFIKWYNSQKQQP